MRARLQDVTQRRKRTEGPWASGAHWFVGGKRWSVRGSLAAAGLSKRSDREEDEIRGGRLHEDTIGIRKLDHNTNVVAAAENIGVEHAEEFRILDLS
jgi:hypothetical protein